MEIFMNRFFITSGSLLSGIGMPSSSIVCAAGPYSQGKTTTDGKDKSELSTVTDYYLHNMAKGENKANDNDLASSDGKTCFGDTCENTGHTKFEDILKDFESKKADVDSAESESKKMLKEAVKLALHSPVGFLVTMLLIYRICCFATRPISFFWLRNPVRRALLESINKEILSDQKLKNSLEEKANCISKEVEDVKKELEEVEAEFNRKDKFIKNNEVNWKEYDKRALKAFGSVTSFLSNYKNKFANSIEKLIEDENLAFKEESGIYEEGMPKEKADELFKSRCEELENRRNVLKDNEGVGFGA